MSVGSRVVYGGGCGEGQHATLHLTAPLSAENISLSFRADPNNGELAVQDLESVFFSDFFADVQYLVIFKFDHLVGFDANQMMVVMGIGLIDFVVLVSFRQF